MSINSKPSTTSLTARSKSAASFENNKRRSSLTKSFKSLLSSRSSRSKSLSRFSLSYRKQKKRRKNKKFACFHCNEEIKAKETNDGFYRRIYRPVSEGFSDSLPSAGRVLSAYVIVSDTEKIKLDVVRDVDFHGTSRMKRKMSKRSQNSSAGHGNSRSFM